MTSFWLKLFACIVMLIDHTGYIFYDTGMEQETYYLMRIIGRIAFPIFAFMMAEGCRKTKSMPKYMLRLMFAGLASEIIFDLAFYKTWFHTADQNVMFTLLLGVIAIYAAQKLREWIKIPLVSIFASLIPAAMCAAAGWFLNTDYGFQGVLCVFFIWLVGESKAAQVMITALCCIFLSFIFNLNSVGFNSLEIFSVFSIIPILIYNGKRGPNNTLIQYGFYAFYPVHLLLLFAVYMLYRAVLL